VFPCRFKVKTLLIWRKTPTKATNKYFNVQQWTKMSKGGHFGEQPDLLAEDIRKFVTNVLVQAQK
jgi:hypothetical protein